MSRRTLEFSSVSVSANSRPDANGELWFMIMDSHGNHFAGHLAQYLESNHVVPAHGCRVDCQIYLGVKGGTLTGILRAISQYFTGHSRALAFDHALEPLGYLNAGAGGPDHAAIVGPAVTFVMERESA